MKTPDQLKKEHQLSNEEILEQANNLIENFIEPQIVAAVKDYKNNVSVSLARIGSLVSIQTHKYDKPTPLGNHLVKKCISVLCDNGYDAYVDDEGVNAFLQITWD